ncbi:DUF5946 family protein [Roseiflexus castenholzii]|uniref:Uncharacterized protein n=1 Tax=Roseiflexus castenholzii (strain DSM 13941 / HLO8) TaxID=383372 RepID=A7NIE0_ROSCS|nr:DUF5946 family protein [Roseiflexus castenholzii]ABU57240.1 conserved hypothetical protein [Roseiflexus castenholzii DSM 13941]
MLEICPGCGVALPAVDGGSHRYIGASPSCWAIFTALVNAGEPPLAFAPLNQLITDAYAAQHPGTPSDQAIQSVAVHTLTLYAILVRGVDPERALWVRQRALRGTRRGRFFWLTPPSFNSTRTIADIVRQSTPEARTTEAQHYITDVWQRWSLLHQQTIADWHEAFVIA